MIDAIIEFFVEDTLLAIFLIFLFLMVLAPVLRFVSFFIPIRKNYFSYNVYVNGEPEPFHTTLEAFSQRDATADLLHYNFTDNRTGRTYPYHMIEKVEFIKNITKKEHYRKV